MTVNWGGQKRRGRRVGHGSGSLPDVRRPAVKRSIAHTFCPIAAPTMMAVRQDRLRRRTILSAAGLIDAGPG